MEVAPGQLSYGLGCTYYHKPMILVVANTGHGPWQVKEAIESELGKLVMVTRI